MDYKNYIVTKRLKKKVICGELNLPYGTTCISHDGFIFCDKGMICATTSQDAYDFFSQNDDMAGLVRGKIVASILNVIRNTKSTSKGYEELWDKIWNDNVCLKYKCADFEDHWLWNYDFYNAELVDLYYIAKLIGAKEAK